MKVSFDIGCVHVHQLTCESAQKVDSKIWFDGTDYETTGANSSFHWTTLVQISFRAAMYFYVFLFSMGTQFTLTKLINYIPNCMYKCIFLVKVATRTHWVILYTSHCSLNALFWLVYLISSDQNLTTYYFLKNVIGPTSWPRWDVVFHHKIEVKLF